MAKSGLKTYLASIGALQMVPRVVIIEQIPGLFITCEVDRETNPLARFTIVFGHQSRLLVRHEKEEARQYALSEAHLLFPEADGWIGHGVVLNEIPRSIFIEMQLFTTAKEVFDRTLRWAGFRPQRRNSADGPRDANL